MCERHCQIDTLRSFCKLYPLGPPSIKSVEIRETSMCESIYRERVWRLMAFLTRDRQTGKVVSHEEVTDEDVKRV